MVKETLFERPDERQNIDDALKSWMMAALTLVFVSLYAVALFGWLKPLTDVTMIARLEPIIFVIIGYYFGRLPAQQNEKFLKDEIRRQTQKADSVQSVKEQIHQQRDTLLEKVKNAKTAIEVAAAAAPRPPSGFSPPEGFSADEPKLYTQNAAVAAALNILDSEISPV